MVAALIPRRHGSKLQGIPKPGGTAGKVELWLEEKLEGRRLRKPEGRNDILGLGTHLENG